ncbi:MAG TPA: nucleoside-diphosphate sugar epimerase/dehydratase [Candidatus Baltobacteraceae bacterium]|nr:nucleoside-diphosphate sugar epimerase/dehydratase [Candidatus Baltobacteraceae bacterium]
MKVAPGLDSTVRGIRPELRFGLLIADFALFYTAVSLATDVGDIHSATPMQMLLLTALLFASGAYVQWRWESARTFDFHDVLRLLYGAVSGTLIALACVWFVPNPLEHASGRLVVIAAMAGFMLRMFLRIGLVVLRNVMLTRRPNAQKVLVVGVGVPALNLIKAIQEDRNLPMRVIGCVDDGVAAKRVDGVRILGGIEDLPQILARSAVDSVIVAIPAAPLPVINRIKDLCSRAPSAPMVKVLPDATEILNDKVTISRIRDIRLEDVLAREPVVVDTAALRPHLEDQVVLVTGAGGSIGSELCRQIATFQPKLLLLLGHGENSLFAIEQELRYEYKFTRTKMILADVADGAAIRSVFSTYRPRIVFHAAAHKHVPIVESNICEAVRNNVLGTRTVALAAAASGAAKMVLLSTDKAVNPTSVMGLTKRMAELICQSFAGSSSTEFVVVRFGNVLGSRGSVVPTFKQQVAGGGPVTITHRDMQRYFMTIPEAVSLVLQAMSMGNDGEVFVLDMGDPIKILHLAEQVIRLSGYEPYRDIQIVETSIRPGEKLFEEILTRGEGISSTSHHRLFIAKQDRLDYSRIGAAMERLQRAIRMSDWRVALDVLREFVPEYTPGTHLLPPPTPIRVERNEIEGASTTHTTEIVTRTNIAPASAQ